MWPYNESSWWVHSNGSVCYHWRDFIFLLEKPKIATIQTKYLWLVHSNDTACIVSVNIRLVVPCRAPATWTSRNTTENIGRHAILLPESENRLIKFQNTEPSPKSDDFPKLAVIFGRHWEPVSKFDPLESPSATTKMLPLECTHQELLVEWSHL